jgi:hypothetical protein
MKLFPFHWPNWRATGERCGLLVLKVAEFGDGGDELIGG